jgi:hypothetical protein
MSKKAGTEGSEAEATSGDVASATPRNASLSPFDAIVRALGRPPKTRKEIRAEINRRYYGSNSEHWVWSRWIARLSELRATVAHAVAGAAVRAVRSGADLYVEVKNADGQVVRLAGPYRREALAEAALARALAAGQAGAYLCAVVDATKR